MPTVDGSGIHVVMSGFLLLFISRGCRWNAVGFHLWTTSAESSGRLSGRVGLERLRDHDGAEVRATNADVHDGVNGLAGVSLPCAAADGLCELLDVRKDRLYLAHTGLLDLEVVEVAERDVEYGAVLRGVDVLTGEHLVAIRLDICLASQREQGLEDRVRDQVLGVVEQEGDWRAVWRDILLAELGESLWVLGKEVLEDEF